MNGVNVSQSASMYPFIENLLASSAAPVGFSNGLLHLDGSLGTLSHPGHRAGGF